AALADFDRALARSPTNFYAAAARARDLEASRDPARALAAYDAILSAPSGQAFIEVPWQRRAALLGKSRALLALDKKAEAVAAAKDAEAIDPVDADVQQMLKTLGLTPVQQ